MLACPRSRSKDSTGVLGTRLALNLEKEDQAKRRKSNPSVVETPPPKGLRTAGAGRVREWKGAPWCTRLVAQMPGFESASDPGSQGKVRDLWDCPCALCYRKGVSGLHPPRDLRRETDMGSPTSRAPQDPFWPASLICFPSV